MKNKLFSRIFISSLIITLLITIMVQVMIIVLAPDMVNEGDSISEMVIVEDHNQEVMGEISDAEEIHYVDTENTSQYIAVIIKRTLPYSLLLSVGVSLIFSFIFSRRISGPIIRMAKATSDMAGMRPGAKSEEKYCEEISQLSDNINQMYAALCENIDSLEKEKNKVIEAEKMKVDFLRAASHELKTPVTSVN